VNGLCLVMDFSASLYLGLLNSEQKCLASRICSQGTRGETAHVILDELLVETGLSHKDITEICVGAGPGSFTGIRVAMAMAQGLAFYKGLPIYPFSSLAALATSVIGKEGELENAHASQKIISAIAANSGRYFVGQDFGKKKTGQESSLENLFSTEELIALALPNNTLVTSGNFPEKEKFQSRFAQILRMEDHVQFSQLMRLAKMKPPVLDGVIRPNYLMASAAEEKRNLNSTVPLG